MKFSRDVPRIVTAVFLIALSIIAVVSPESGNEYANLILVGITAVYAYLTYELLRISRSSRPSPYINIEYVVVSDLQSEFFKQYEPFAEKSEEYLLLLNEAGQETGAVGNIVFVKAENAGDSLAIDIELEAQYSKRNFLDEHNSLKKTLKFKNLQKGEKSLKIFEVYDHPSTNDYLNIQKLVTKFKDIGSHNSGEGKTVNDFTGRLGHVRDEQAAVVFKEG